MRSLTSNNHGRPSKSFERSPGFFPTCVSLSSLFFSSLFCSSSFPFSVLPGLLLIAPSLLSSH